MTIKTVYITGAASGLGQEIARRYASQGTNLALFDIHFDEESCKKIEAIRSNTQQRIGYYEADVCDCSALMEKIALSETEVGCPNMVLHCAGVQKAGTFDTVSQEEFERVVRINLFGSRNVAQGSIPLLKKVQGPAKLVFVSSMAGFVGTFAYSSYSSSKFGVLGLAQTLRMELAAENVKVQVICPPEVDTPMVHKEHKCIHPATLKLKLMTGTLSLNEAINSIMSGLKRDSFYIIPGFKARVTYWLTRLLPVWLSNAITDFIVRKALKQHA